MPPVQPMLAKSVSGVPDPAKHGGLSFEPKWDGFRCLVFKDGDEVELASRNTKPLTRYFPEVVEAVRRQLPERIVLDGEIFVGLQGPDGWRLEFETLQERIHPAASRVDKLSVETPAGFVAFDLLALGDESFMRPPARRAPRRARRGARPPRRQRPVLPHPHHRGPRRGGAVVRGVRGRRARRRRRQAARVGVRAQQAHHAQDQARAHGRRRPRRLPRAQDVHAGGAADRLAAARACTTTTASCSTSASRPASPPRGAPSSGTSCSRWSATSPTTRGAGGTSSSPPTPTASPAPRAGGAPARTSGSPPCAPSGCWR